MCYSEPCTESTSIEKELTWKAGDLASKGDSDTTLKSQCLGVFFVCLFVFRSLET